MKELTKTLTHKYGPLKLWAWLGIGGLGIVWYRRRQAAAGGGGQGDTGLGSNATSPNTPPDLFYQPGGSLPVDTSGGGQPSSGGSDGLAGLLAILRQLVNQRNPPKKKHHKPHKKPPVKHHKPGHKHRPRSTTHVRVPTDRPRKITHKNPVARNRNGTPKNKATRRTRGNLKQTLVKGRTIRQRPATGHQPAHRTGPTPTPRPSAPKQRTMRAPKARKK